MAMKQMPDNAFDLAVVDPPYGIGYDSMAKKTGGTRSSGAAAKKRVYHTANWDNNRPSPDYFAELFRVSKQAIIWGGVITLPICCHHLKDLFVGTNG